MREERRLFPFFSLFPLFKKLFPIIPSSPSFSKEPLTAALLGANTVSTVSGLSSLEVRLAALTAAEKVESEGSAWITESGDAGGFFF